MKKYIKGVTLAELMVVITVMSLIMLGIGTFFSRGVTFFRLSEAKTFVQRDARHSLSLMNKYLRQAKASTVRINRLNNTQPPYSWIKFTTIKDETITYYQETTKLYQEVEKDGSSHKNMLTENLMNISFTYPKTDDDSIIHIAICLVKIPHPYIKGAKALQLSVEKVRIMN